MIAHPNKSHPSPLTTAAMEEIRAILGRSSIAISARDIASVSSFDYQQIRWALERLRDAGEVTNDGGRKWRMVVKGAA